MVSVKLKEIEILQSWLSFNLGKYVNKLSKKKIHIH